MRWIASLLLFLGSAAPAHAAICGRYAKPLDQADAAQLLAEAKFTFPARQRALLDTLQPVIRNDLQFQVYYARTGQMREMVISSDYLRTACLLTLVWMLESDRKQGKQDIPDVSFLDKCTDSATRLRCLLEGMNAIVAKEDAARSGSHGKGDDIPPSAYVALGSAVTFTIGHEIGHLLIDADPSLMRDIPEQDAELAADLLALQTMFSGRTIPWADEFAFASHAVTESNATQPAAHEASACRLRRAKLLRERLRPDLDQVLAWNNPLLQTAYLGSGTASAEVPLPYDLAPQDCDATLPPAVDKVARDLARLASTVAALPAQLQIGETHLEAMRTIPVETQFGRSLKASILAAGHVAVLGSIGAANASPDDRIGNARRIAKLEKLGTGGDVRDLTSVEYRNYMLARAMGRFFASRPGSRLTVNARRLQRDIAAVARYGPPDALFEMNAATASMMAGQCREGFAGMVRFLELYETIQRDFGLEFRKAEIDLTEAYGPQTPQILEFARKIKTGAIPDTPATCAAMRTNLSANFKRNFSWRD